MTLSLFDQSLFEKVVALKYPGKNEFNKVEILNILNEMTKAEKYYPRGQVVRSEKFKIFKYFVRYCLYRNIANYDSMILLTGDKGCLTYNTKFKTPTGITSFKKMNLKDRDIFQIMSYDFKKNKSIPAFAQFFDTGVKSVYEIELDDGTKIKSTEDHTFFVKRKEKIIELKLKDIKEKDLLVKE